MSNPARTTGRLAGQSARPGVEVGLAVKRFIGLLLGIAGVALCLYCGYYILIEPGRGLIQGYHPMYPGLLGIALLTLGIVFHQN